MSSASPTARGLAAVSPTASAATQQEEVGLNGMEEFRARLRRLEELEGRVLREAQLEARLKQSQARIDDYEDARVLTDGRMAKLEAEVAAQTDAKRRLERELEVAQLLLRHQESPQSQRQPIVVTSQPLQEQQQQHQQPEQQQQPQRQQPTSRTSPSPVPLSSSSSKGPRTTFDEATNGLDDGLDAAGGGVDESHARREQVLQEQVLRMYEVVETLKQDREFAAMQTSAARGEAAAAAAGRRETISAFESLGTAYRSLEARLSQSAVVIGKKDAENQHLKIQNNISQHQLRGQLVAAEKERDALRKRVTGLSRSEAQRALEARAMEGQLAEARAARASLAAQLEGLSAQLGLVHLDAPAAVAADGDAHAPAAVEADATTGAGAAAVAGAEVEVGAEGESGEGAS